MNAEEREKAASLLDHLSSMSSWSAHDTATLQKIRNALMLLKEDDSRGWYLLTWKVGGGGFKYVLRAKSPFDALLKFQCWQCWCDNQPLDSIGDVRCETISRADWLDNFGQPPEMGLAT